MGTTVRERKREPRRVRSRSRPTVSEAARPLRVSVITYPTSGVAGPTLHRDVELVKSAILYADEVELISPGAAMVSALATLADSGLPGMIELLGSLDDATLAQIGGSGLLGHRGTLAALPALLDPAVASALGFEEDLDALRETLDGPLQQLRRISDQMAIDAGANELAPAIEQNLLVLDLAGIDRGDTDAMVKGYTEMILQRLRDPRRRVLFDSATASLARRLLESSDLDEIPGLRRAGQAAVGSGLVGRLPAFPGAPMDELLELRVDLRDELIRYRSATLKLAGSLDPSLGDELEAQVDDVWVAAVEPAMLEIRETLADHSLVRELAKSAATDVKAFVFGGASVYMGLAASTSLDQAANVLLSAAGGSVATGARAAWDSHTARGVARRHELFYLYAADRRLS